MTVNVAMKDIVFPRNAIIGLFSAANIGNKLHIYNLAMLNFILQLFLAGIFAY